MESYKSYTDSDIEKLKKKVIAYKNLLTTLKLGVSLEDFLFIKGEFEDLKMQMSQIDALKDDVVKEQLEPIEEYEVKQFSTQLTSLNQMVEEVLSTLNKIAVGEVKKEVHEETISPPIVSNMREARQPDLKSNDVITQPSYSQLRSLAGQVIYQNKIEETIKPVENTEKTILNTQQQQRHFNHSYFQSINTQPNNIYNGLYKNMQMKTSTRPKEIDELPKRMSGILYEPDSPTEMSNSIEHEEIHPFLQNEVKDTTNQVVKFNGMTPLSSIISPRLTKLGQQADQLDTLVITPIQVEAVTEATNHQQNEQPPTLIAMSNLIEKQSAQVSVPQQTEQFETSVTAADETSTANQGEEVTEATSYQQNEQPPTPTILVEQEDHPPTLISILSQLEKQSAQVSIPQQTEQFETFVTAADETSTANQVEEVTEATIDEQTEQQLTPFIATDQTSTAKVVEEVTEATPQQTELLPTPARLVEQEDSLITPIVITSRKEQHSDPLVMPSILTDQTSKANQVEEIIEVINDEQTEQQPTPDILVEQVEELSAPTIKSEQEIEPVSQLDETHLGEDEKKKQRINSFFNFFRR